MNGISMVNPFRSSKANWIGRRCWAHETNYRNGWFDKHLLCWIIHAKANLKDPEIFHSARKHTLQHNIANSWLHSKYFETSRNFAFGPVFHYSHFRWVQKIFKLIENFLVKNEAIICFNFTLSTLLLSFSPPKWLYLGEMNRIDISTVMKENELAKKD